ncbi:hypothetical protein Q5O14_07815 [Eubacteriaceae bacterium ES2]|nr:hypothetical protein Q5O14_07815 [Eubacteriaceae bacterium ES2]
MIEIRKCNLKKNGWECFECGSNNLTGKQIYWISIHHEECGRAGLRLCEDCLKELIEKINEVEL